MSGEVLAVDALLSQSVVDRVRLCKDFATSAAHTEGAPAPQRRHKVCCRRFGMHRAIKRRVGTICVCSANMQLYGWYIDPCIHLHGRHRWSKRSTRPLVPPRLPCPVHRRFIPACALLLYSTRRHHDSGLLQTTVGGFTTNDIEQE